MAKRQETEILCDLAGLCQSPGFAHALAYFCFRDGIISFEGTMQPDDLTQMYSRNHLLRTELVTLAGFMLRSDIDWHLPEPEALQQMCDKAEVLLEELHDTMGGLPALEVDDAGQIILPPDLLTSGAAMREAFFYSGESAYGSQYRDFALKRYHADNAWLEANLGFSIEEAGQVVRSSVDLQNKTIIETYKGFAETPAHERTILPGFEFTIADLAACAGLSQETVQKVVTSFSVTSEERNLSFNDLHDFNVITSRPIIRKDADTYVLFNQASLVAALYESPIFWMSEDKTYASKAFKHRGEFTEEFARDRLVSVFGEDRVFQSVDIGKLGAQSGEIDVLVVFGDRALVLQAKSKRLTLEARKGNDTQIKDDFKKAVVEAYDQAFACAEALLKDETVLRDSSGNILTLPTKLRHIYPICVVSDHYPALAFQVQDTLSVRTTPVIEPPLVVDVFALDAMAELLDRPLRFLAYLHLRAKFRDKFHVSHEFTLLSNHLQRNLWAEKGADFIYLEDSIAIELDIAMAVRRDGIPGKATPDGILTKFETGAIRRVLDMIEAEPTPERVDFALVVQELSEGAYAQLEDGIQKLTDAAKRDGLPQDMTMPLEDGVTGITVHVNWEDNTAARNRLELHCTAAKYRQKANDWFGLCFDPMSSDLRFLIAGQFPWRYDAAVAEVVQTHFSKSPMSSSASRKVPVNAPCPCGSGIKFKKCCR